MLQASAQAVDFKVGRHFGEGQVEPSRKVTVPVGEPLNAGWTVEVMVTDWP